jgi:hypothetical protein
MDFATFKAGQPAKTIFRKLGLTDCLEAATSWRALRAVIVDFNGCNEANFVKLVRQCDTVASSGERTLLHAICYATDFAWLADELSNGMAWQNMNCAAGDWRRAVAACIEADTRQTVNARRQHYRRSHRPSSGAAALSIIMIMDRLPVRPRCDVTVDTPATPAGPAACARWAH